MSWVRSEKTMDIVTLPPWSPLHEGGSKRGSIAGMLPYERFQTSIKMGSFHDIFSPFPNQVGDKFLQFWG